jgi:hypothetical protein
VKRRFDDLVVGNLRAGIRSAVVPCRSGRCARLGVRRIDRMTNGTGEIVLDLDALNLVYRATAA